MTNDKILKEIKDYSVITLGVIMVAIALEYFFVPNNLAAGGLSGLALIINHYFPIISVGEVLFIGNLFLYIIAFIIIGPQFGMKTIYASYMFSGIVWVIESFLKPRALTNDLMLAVIFGTLLTASGLAIVFNRNASTGGTDILAKILNKYSTFNIGVSLLVVDFIVTLIGGLTFGMDTGFYALVCVLANGPIIDKIIAIMNEKKQVTIVSEKNEQISEFIKNNLGMSCTNFYGKGKTSNVDKDILYAILDKKQLVLLKSFIKKIDKDSFITISSIEEVVGKDFPQLDY